MKGNGPRDTAASGNVPIPAGKGLGGDAEVGIFQNRQVLSATTLHQRRKFISDTFEGKVVLVTGGATGIG
jgi:hypothetical protein